ncbi:hypothetical protein GCM10009672_17170 [Nesterenkonia lutea]
MQQLLLGRVWHGEPMDVDAPGDRADILSPNSISGKTGTCERLVSERAPAEITRELLGPSHEPILDENDEAAQVLHRPENAPSVRTSLVRRICWARCGVPGAADSSSRCNKRVF